MTIANKPTTEELRRLYVDERMSHRAIDEMFGVSTDVAKNWCRKAGLVGARPNDRGNTERQPAPTRKRAPTRPKPAKRGANLLGPRFYPVEVHKRSLALRGPALRLPEEQQRKVRRLLAIYEMYWQERYRKLLMKGKVTP